jgi:hypothetical protein
MPGSVRMTEIGGMPGSVRMTEIGGMPGSVRMTEEMMQKCLGVRICLDERMSKA